MFRNDGFSSFPYLLIGIGVGMVAGLLLAPRSGERCERTFAAAPMKEWII